MRPGPVFVIAAPLAGARRTATWLGQPTQVRSRWLIENSGPDWDRHSDRFREGPERWPEALARMGMVRLPRFEAHPVLALNVDVLARTFPNARFLFLYRDVRENLARMLQAWDAQTRPHPSNIDVSPGKRWCLTLPPGWSSVAHLSIPEIVAWQWSTTMHLALDALQDLPPERWAIASFDQILSEPDQEFLRLRSALGLPAKPMPRPFATGDELSPDVRIWQPDAARLTPVLSQVAQQANRAVQLFARQPTTRVRR